MMITSNTQPKWASIGVRLWSAYLVLATSLLCLLLFAQPDVPVILWLLLLLAILRIIDLWRLRNLGRVFALSLLGMHLVVPFPYLLNTSANSVTLTLAMLAVPVGVAGLIFFTRPAVKALFQNQKSEINNQKSPNA